jgi:hypothetical protein
MTVTAASSLFEIFLYLAAGAMFSAILIAALAGVVWLVTALTFSATHPEPVRSKAVARTTGKSRPVP